MKNMDPFDCSMICVCIYPIPPPWAGCDTRSIFKQSTVVFNSAFPLPDWLSNQGKEPYLLYYLIKAGRTIGFMPFPSALVCSEICKQLYPGFQPESPILFPTTLILYIIMRLHFYCRVLWLIKLYKICFIMKIF